MNVKAEPILWVFVLTLAAWAECLSGPPPNDNYADRIVLTGNSNQMTGTLVGTTMQSHFGSFEISGGVGLQSGHPSGYGSVWWQWVASESVPVTIQVVGFPLGPVSNDGGINVWAPTNLNDFPTNDPPLYPVCVNDFDSTMPGTWATFVAEAGQAYIIQLIGQRTGTFTLRLVADINPFIFEHPKPQTISAGASAFFGVMAAGPVPLSYQWFRDGIPLTGETAATLALNDLGADAAGSYFVTVSNAFGVSTSSPATLQVRQTAERPGLSHAGTLIDGFSFALSGESNRYYRIERSTNGINWKPAEYFATDAIRNTSVIATTNVTSAVVVPKDAPLGLFRAGLYAPVSEECNNNLRRIRYAKRLWAQQFQGERTESATWAALSAYMNTPVIGSLPTIGSCPSGGTYITWPMSQYPTCAVTNHVLEEPW